MAMRSIGPFNGAMTFQPWIQDPFTLDGNKPASLASMEP